MSAQPFEGQCGCFDLSGSRDALQSCLFILAISSEQKNHRVGIIYTHTYAQ